MEEIKIGAGINYIHIFSGGLDSTYSLLKLAKEIGKGQKTEGGIHPVFFDYGQAAANNEWRSVQNAIKFISSALNNMGAKIDNPVSINLRSGLFTWCGNVAFTGIEVGDEIPEIQNRNMVLISVLASYLYACAENQKIPSAMFEVHSGFKDGEMADCNRGFFDDISKLLYSYKKNYEINFILLNNMKRQTIINKTKKLLGGKEKLVENILAITTYCYSAVDGKSCGVCWKCKKIEEEKKRRHSL